MMFASYLACKSRWNDTPLSILVFRLVVLCDIEYIG